jgi:hypothetical protein
MNKIQFWLKIRKLQKEKSKIYNEYKNKKVGKKGEELQLISHEYSAEVDLIDDEIWELHTNYIRKNAAQLIIPLPNDDSCWKKSKITGLNLLSAKGVYEMKNKIRIEYNLWLSYVAALTGVLGAATGLLAVWSNLYK